MAPTSLYTCFLIKFLTNCLSVNGFFVNDDGLNSLFSSSVKALLREELQHEKITLHPQEVQGWPRSPVDFGQISGVAVDPNHQPVIFHRGPRVWDAGTFNETNHFQLIDQVREEVQNILPQISLNYNFGMFDCTGKFSATPLDGTISVFNFKAFQEGPIPVDTVLTLDRDSGEIIKSWGKNFFYLPHGLTIDNYGYYYMTDIGLHQSFKFNPGSAAPLLTFGKPFEPGSGIHHLCKPTDVAVAVTGEIFIADGYCNSRILEYDSDGNLLNILPMNQDYLPLNVPHSITLLHDLDLLCIADRENVRIVCTTAELRRQRQENSPVLSIQQADMGRIFAVTSMGNKIFAINGPSKPMVQVKGMTIDPVLATVEDQWTPTEGFRNPHDLEVSHKTNSIYVAEINPNRIWKFQLKSLL